MNSSQSIFQHIQQLWALSISGITLMNPLRQISWVCTETTCHGCLLCAKIFDCGEKPYPSWNADTIIILARSLFISVGGNRFGWVQNDSNVCVISSFLQLTTYCRLAAIHLNWVPRMRERKNMIFLRFSTKIHRKQGSRQNVWYKSPKKCHLVTTEFGGVWYRTS